MVLRLSWMSAGRRQTLLRGWRWRLGLTGPGFNTEALARGQPEGTEEHGVTGVKLSDADAWMVETGASGVQSESTISHLIFDISEAGAVKVKGADAGFWMSD